MKRDRLTILREAEHDRRRKADEDTLYVQAERRSTQYRDDLAYRAKVLAFEAKQTVPLTVGVDPAAPGGDCTAIVRPPTTKRSFQVGDRVRVVHDGEAPTASGLRNGQEHTISAVGLYSAAGKERVKLADPGMKKFKFMPDRFELVEAVGSTEAATHSVCITAHNGCHIGKVLEGDASLRLCPDFWLPCDKDGWITHEPKADSVCPVPASVTCEIRFRNGSVLPDDGGLAGGDSGYAGTTVATWDWGDSGYAGTTIAAWKPVAS